MVRGMDRAQRERESMEATVVKKVWEIPAHGGKGPLTIKLLMPEVRTTDSEGRPIVISPAQADLVSDKMGDISVWLEDGAQD